MPGGYLGGWRHPFDKYSLRSYFMLQQLQSYYGKAFIKSIQYANKEGKLFDVSSAIATDTHRRSQLKLVYDNGLEIWVNGSKKDHWKTPHADLPPSGYYAKLKDEELEVFSATSNGKRGDYVTSQSYDFIDGRGSWLVTPFGATDKQLIILKNEDGSREIIPYETEKFAINLDKKPNRVIALDKDKNEISQAKGKFKDGLFHIEPITGAFSYLIIF
jgi:hypothetical protein